MNTMKQIFDYHINLICQEVDVFPWENKELVCKWLNQQYYLVRNSTRYIALAASQVPLEDNQDFKWWAHHLSEEMDHDKTILKDLKVLGRLELDPIFPETRAIIAAQYYDITTFGADALIGYALSLEGLSVARCGIVNKHLEKHHQMKSGYLHLHGEVDIDHYSLGIKRIEDFSPERKKIILQNLEMMSALYLNLWQSYNKFEKVKEAPKAA